MFVRESFDSLCSYMNILITYHHTHFLSTLAYTYRSLYTDHNQRHTQHHRTSYTILKTSLRYNCSRCPFRYHNRLHSENCIPENNLDRNNLIGILFKPKTKQKRPYMFKFYTFLILSRIKEVDYTSQNHFHIFSLLQ